MTVVISMAATIDSRTAVSGIPMLLWPLWPKIGSVVPVKEIWI